MELLLTGMEYGKLPDAYVIFICDFDPFGKGKYCYTFKNMCAEEGELLLNEGTYTIFLNTKGKNETEVPERLVKFLKFVSADLEGSKKDFEDDFVKQLQNSIQNIKSSREMEERFMILREMLRDERNEGRLENQKENIFEALEELGPVPPELHNKIEQENDMAVLKEYHKKAIRAKSMEQFQKEIL